MKLIFILSLTIINSVCYSQKLTSGGVLKPEQAIMDVRHYTINLAVDIEQKSISGYTIIDFILSQNAPVLLFDLLNDMQVEKIWINGQDAPFKHENGLITINPSAPVNAGKASVKINPRNFIFSCSKVVTMVLESVDGKFLEVSRAGINKCATITLPKPRSIKYLKG